jgi:hypothetical protein
MKQNGTGNSIISQKDSDLSPMKQELISLYMPLVWLMRSEKMM